MLPRPVVDFAPFELRPGAEVSPGWLCWLGHALRPDSRALAPPPDDALAVLPALDAHGLLPLLYLRLRDSLPRPEPVEEPSPVLQALAEGFQANALRSYLMELELARITAGLAAKAVPVALLKGAATGRMVYDSFAARPVNDLDLLVPAARVTDGRDALAALGYRPHGPLGDGQFGRWQRRYRAELQMVCGLPDRQGLLVEFHWSLVELPYFIDRIPMQDVWATAGPCASLPGASLLDPASLLLHTCAHVASHHSRDLRLIWLVDVDRLARWQALDWESVLERAGRWGLGLAAHAVIEAASRWLGTPLPPDIMVRLAEMAGDPVSQAMWGLGDERPGRARRRARATWGAFTTRQRLRYGAWLLLRALARPFETMRRNAYRRQAH